MVSLKKQLVTIVDLISIHEPIIWAARQENVSSRFVNNIGTDQPAQPCRLISAFVMGLLETIISKLASSKFSIF